MNCRIQNMLYFIFFKINKFCVSDTYHILSLYTCIVWWTKKKMKMELRKMKKVGLYYFFVLKVNWTFHHSFGAVD